MANWQRPSNLAFRALQVGVIVLVLLTAAGLTGNGPLAWLHKKSSSSASVGNPPSTTARTGPTSSTLPELEERAYEKGDCVTWDQSATGERRNTDVVPCTQPHLVEIAGHIDMSPKLDKYPTETAWNRVFDQDCLPSLRALMGVPLDPIGRFAPGGLRPLVDAWTDGDRTVWCGAELATARHDSPTLTPFTGKVEGVSQNQLIAVGTCLTATAPNTVPCARPHLGEVTGYVDLSGATTTPPGPDDDRAWNALVGDKCAQLACAYVGHDLGRDETAGWIPVMAASWAAGRRVVECSVARTDASNRPIKTVGSLRG